MDNLMENYTLEKLYGQFDGNYTFEKLYGQFDGNYTLEKLYAQFSQPCMAPSG